VDHILWLREIASRENCGMEKKPSPLGISRRESAKVRRSDLRGRELQEALALKP
jgi:hypothetical protein